MSHDSPKRRGIVRRFFRFLWRSIRALNTLVFGILSVLLIAAIIFSLVSQRGMKIPTGVALVLDPQGMLVEQESFVGTAALLQGSDLPQQALVQELVDALAKAKEDDRIKLVVLELDGLDYGLLPKLERIAAAITDFKTSGKKVIATADNYSQSALYIAAHADEVLLNPEGVAVPEGFAMHSAYFKSFLDKHEVTVNLFKVGRYKSAADSFLRDDMSAEDEEAKQAIIDAWWQAYTNAIEEARGMTTGSINAMFERASEQLRAVEGNLARLSLDKGFVDRLLSDTQERSYLIELAGEDDGTHGYRHVRYKEYLSATRSFKPPQADKVAVITAVGPILDGQAEAGQIGSKSLTRLIRKARLDSDVKAIVLRIDSGGGSKTASEIIRSELQAAQDAGIPVVASMGSIAASGGYWIAASADEIWASPTTVTGSIGIFGLLPTFEKTLARYGIYSDGLSTTPIAGGASTMRGITPEYGEVLQSIIEAGYEQFLSTVAKGRDMDMAAVDAIAQGRIWTGEKAMELGLVDELGDMDQAIGAASQLAGVSDYSVWHVEPERSFEEQLIRKFAESVAGNFPSQTHDPVSRLTAMVRKELGLVARLNDPHHAYVICAECLALQ